MICATEVINAMFDTALTKEVDCPECFIRHKDMPYRYVDMFNESGDLIGRIALGLSEYNSECLLHGEVVSWTKENLKAFKTGFFGTVVPGLQSLGVTKIVVVNGVQDKGRWTRFIKMIHFSEPEEFIYSTMEI